MSIELWKAIFDWSAVVFVGLSIIAGSLALITGKKIGDRQDEKLRDFSVGLTTAQTNLETQKERAAKAEANIALAQQRASEADAKAESFRLDIAKAERGAAEATKAAENERIERLKLEAQIAPRRLTLAETKAIASRCASLRLISVRVSSYALDVESAVLAKQIITALQAAGINVEDRTASLMSMSGFVLAIHVSGTDENAEELIRQALSEDGRLVVAPLGTQQPPFTGMSLGDQTPVAVSILVGVKPVN